MSRPEPCGETDALRSTARRVLEIESRAVAGLIDRLDDDFNRAVDLLVGCSGRVVLTGMGKSGIISQKIAATLSSTGTPAFFVHPVEASHGRTLAPPRGSGDGGSAAAGAAGVPAVPSGAKGGRGGFDSSALRG